MTVFAVLVRLSWELVSIHATRVSARKAIRASKHLALDLMIEEFTVVGVDE